VSHQPGLGRSLARPAFAGDDGAADPAVRALLADPAGSPRAVARALRSARLLAPVVAVLDSGDESGGEKDSHMAAVSLVNEAGDRALLAFSGLDSMAAWDPAARPVPASGRDLARVARDDGARAVLVDLAGPRPVVLADDALAALAGDLDLPAASAVVLAALAGLTADGWVEVVVEDGSAGPDADVIVRVSTRGHPDGRSAAALARRAADLLADRADLAAAAPGGVGVVLAD
jgi:hypothetical protein